MGIISEGQTIDNLISTGIVLTWTGHRDGSTNVLWSSEAVYLSGNTSPDYVGSLDASELARIRSTISSQELLENDQTGWVGARATAQTPPLLCTTHIIIPYLDILDAATGAFQACTGAVDEHQVRGELQIRRHYYLFGWYSTQAEARSEWMSTDWASISMTKYCSDDASRQWRGKALGEAFSTSYRYFNTGWFTTPDATLPCDV